MGLEGLGDFRPFAGMGIVILAQVSNMVVVKAAMSRGMDKYVIIAYSNGLASLLCFLCSIIFHSLFAPPITFNILCGFILISLLGIMSQICELAGVQYSSPTLGTAVLNIIPAFTFILAIIFRMEKLEWRSSSSKAKVVGAIVSIGGAFVVTLYKGPTMMKTSSSHQQQSNWIFGGLLLATDALLSSAMYIVQVLVLNKCTAPLLMLLYTISFGAILSFMYGLIVVDNFSPWRLRLDMGLVAILYSAVAALLIVGLSLWCLWKTGPLFVSMFKPLGIVFGALMSVVFLGDVLSLGSVIGSVTIMVGFYLVMWGKAKEKKGITAETENGVESSVSTSNKLPLLHNKIEDI